MVESPTDSDEWSEATIAEKLEQINADGEKKADEATTAIAELLATFDQEVTLESESDIEEFVESLVVHSGSRDQSLTCSVQSEAAESVT